MMADPADDTPLELRDPQSGRPLRVLITRPDEQAEETAELVRAAHGLPLLFPCLHRAPAADPAAFTQALSHPDGYAVVAVASANTALAIGEALRRLPEAAARKLGRALFAAVGPRTAAVLRAQGLAVPVIASDDNSGEGLCAAIDAALRAQGQTLREKRVLVPHAVVSRPELLAALRRAGAQVTETVAYEMVPADATALAPIATLLRAGEVDLLPFGSPRTAAIALSSFDITDQANAAWRSRVVIGAIGHTTEAALREAGLRVDVVAQPATFTALLRQMRDFYIRTHVAAHGL